MLGYERLRRVPASGASESTHRKIDTADSTVARIFGRQLTYLQ